MKVAKQAIPAAVKVATGGALNLDELTAEVLVGVAAEIAKAGVEEFTKSKGMIVEFRNQLEQFAGELSASGEGPLVIFVDELDRSRPSHAIALLERIKHLFNVRGIVVVLVLDRSELANTVAALYGIADTGEYLSG